MKNSILLLGTFLVFILQLVNAQQHRSTLDGNSVSATIFDEGRLFHSPNTAMPGYEFPKGSGKHLIFSGGFWFGGTNQNGELKLAAQLYGDQREFYRGSLSSTGQYMDTAYIYNYESGIWTIKKSEVIYHIDNFDQNGYEMPEAILNWPGNGNLSIGVASQLAPYIDLNNNEIYEPHLGDYPCIKGDMASYQIMHDDGEHFSSGGERIGAEIHMMIYQIQSNNLLDSTTFIDLKLINRGQNSFDDFRAAIFIDADVGSYGDDYIGSDPSRNLMYAYNSNNNDVGFGSPNSYGVNPPAVGFVCLNRDIEYSGTIFRQDLSPIPNVLDMPAEYWLLMNGRWINGDEWTYGGNGFGGTTPTQHLFDGNPYLGTGWTELDNDGSGTPNPPGDKRMLMTTVEEFFNPGDTLVYNYAVIANRQGNYLENVQGVMNYTDSVQLYFDNNSASCIQQGTGIADIFEEVEENLKLNFEITRLDGEGNMSRAVTLHEWTEYEIVTQNAVDKIRYKRGKGPIEARLTDTINHALGHFVIKFHEYDDIDTANWTIYHYDTIGGILLDSANSNSGINLGNEQFFPQWGMAIRIEQINYYCGNLNSNCLEREMHAKPLEASLHFEDANLKWLTGVKNTNVNSPLNWIRSGSIFPQVNPPIIDSVFSPNCYSSNGSDPFNTYSKLADGIVSPSMLTRNNDCYFAPLVVPSSVVNDINIISIQKLQQPTVYQPSIDLVFTDDTSKWTRSPVIELNSFDVGSVNGGIAGFLRKSNSVDKQGNPDGSGTGMGWFPGYAIDVETGRRLNIAFGENSTLTNDNGDDMIWNPTERLFDNNGNYVLGGQHVIYVFGREELGMPIYDQGAFIHQKLSAETVVGFSDVFSNLSWVMQPLLAPGTQLNSTDVRLRIRINKEFKTKILSNQNEGRPMFSWNAVPYDEIWMSNKNETNEGNVSVFPNPAANQITIAWDEVKVDEIEITSYQGRVVRKILVEGVQGEKTIDISGFSSGVYFVNIGSVTKKLVVQ
ncbi:T9SS type A sorting domain-containing protein [Brumimicrobium oceani]|uniref:Secretion system C-terminal sorting domain-containing protein n=1 Tax=Brumimicrobium oceani TaxID=2100725 RepID=A0A2U2XBF3_9FLAO|nr:T9SS type A sorting domain-containing protein [Brumimicrobium oceani]PWH85129.1 hypothetical protein DIT68_10865 [Brumimicrobium oceani]